MGRKMTPLQALKKVKQARYFVDFELDAKVGEDYKKELDLIESALKEHEAMKQTKIVVADDKVNEEELKKLINQRMFTTNLQPCKINLLFDEETRKKIKALETIKNNIVKTIDEQLIVHNELDNSITFEFKVNVKTQEDYDLLKEVLL